MTAQDFSRLLALFGSDAEAAAAGYEAIRVRLQDFFRYAQLTDPAAAADEVFDRVAAKLAEGVEIENATSYVLAVARFVRQEKWTAAKKYHAALLQMPAPDPPSAEDAEREHRCLDQCLAHWPALDRDFLLAYYQGDGAGRIAQRHRLAAEEGITVNALRNRALRLRARLEDCLQKCLAGDGKANSRTEGKKG